MLKSIICLSLLFVFSNLSAYADEIAANECVADISKYTKDGLKQRVSVFDKKSNKYKKVSDSKLIKYGFEDSATLQDGTLVTMTLGGCAHYGYTFSFSGIGVKPIKNNNTKEKISRAISLLKNLDVTEKSQTNELIQALQSSTKTPPQTQGEGVYSLPCGDATCELVDSGINKIKISYSFAL